MVQRFPEPTAIDARCKDPRCSHDAEKTYRLEGACSNCGTEVVGTFTYRHEASDDRHECPNCGCRELRWCRRVDTVVIEGAGL